MPKPIAICMCEYTALTMTEFFSHDLSAQTEELHRWITTDEGHISRMLFKRSRKPVEVPYEIKLPTYLPLD